jgi:hypothetical protein
MPEKETMLGGEFKCSFQLAIANFRESFPQMIIEAIASRNLLTIAFP